MGQLLSAGKTTRTTFDQNTTLKSDKAEYLGLGFDRLKEICYTTKLRSQQIERESSEQSPAP